MKSLHNPENRSITMQFHKSIALIAHDKRKQELSDWVEHNRELLEQHTLYATGTTGKKLADDHGLEIHRFRSGPLGGDQQVGAKICEGEIDFLIFFWDPLEAQPHDVDVKALLRLAVVYNIPVACNRSTADFMVTSQLMNGDYERMISEYEKLFKA